MQQNMITANTAQSLHKKVERLHKNIYSTKKYQIFTLQVWIRKVEYPYLPKKFSENFYKKEKKYFYLF